MQSRKLKILNTYLEGDTNIAFGFLSYFFPPQKVLAWKDRKLCICQVKYTMILVIPNGSESEALTTNLPKKVDGKWGHPSYAHQTI